MTVIVNYSWGGRSTLLVDRHISQRVGTTTRVVDTQSVKTLVLANYDCIVSLAYTGVAVVHHTWVDNILANAIACTEMSAAVLQPPTMFLNRPLIRIVRHLARYIDSEIGKDKRARLDNIKIIIIDFHANRSCTPLCWEIQRTKYKVSIKMNSLGKFLRENPYGLSIDCHGDYGSSFKDRLAALARTENLTHDEVEKYVRNLIRARSLETDTVGEECLAIQIDPSDIHGYVQSTIYPSNKERPLVSPWVLTPGGISAPTEHLGPTELSECGSYAYGVFCLGNSNFKVRCRVPIEQEQKGKQGVIDVRFVDRASVV